MTSNTERTEKLLNKNAVDRWYVNVNLMRDVKSDDFAIMKNTGDIGTASFLSPTKRSRNLTSPFFLFSSILTNYINI